MSDTLDDRSRDRALGMDRDITRRDFLNGVAIGVGGALAGAWLPGLPGIAWDGNGVRAAPPGPQDAAGYYPPTRTGLRGSHPGSFEVGHALRDGAFWSTARVTDTGERYDLVVVGGGISGLAAAHFYRKRNPSARVLIIDNHDDFGGHAKRNEFHVGGRMLLMNGGTLLINSPTPYSPVADGLLKEFGVDPPALDARATDRKRYRSLGLRPAMFFDSETFGADRLVVGVPRGSDESAGDDSGDGTAHHRAWTEFLARTPLSPEAQQDIARLQEAKIDYLPGLTSAQKKDQLSRMSYKDFLLNVVKVHPEATAFYQTRTHGEWGVGIDAEPALDCWAQGLPGFQGLGLEPGPAPRMSYTAAGYASGGSYSFHFPDGNASIARLLVRSLIPDAVPGHTAEDIVTARVDYNRLDHGGAPVRIRLNNAVVRARHVGNPESAKEVEVTYTAADGREHEAHTVRAGGVVLACWNMMIPFVCPELPDPQKEALHYLNKVPLVYTTVAVRNWTAFQKLGVQNISAPGSYWSSVSLNSVVNIGAYTSPRSPAEPTLVHLVRTPCKPGLPVRDQQTAGRTELFTTTFETFERHIRDQLARTLGSGGFDPARDIVGIMVNRWPHGYGYEYNPLFDPEWPLGQAPHEIGRRPFGRITIANSDSGATAYTNVAIDQAHRAVEEQFAANP